MKTTGFETTYLLYDAIDDGIEVTHNIGDRCIEIDIKSDDTFFFTYDELIMLSYRLREIAEECREIRK